jgi:hypothetical protein
MPLLDSWPWVYDARCPCGLSLERSETDDPLDRGPGMYGLATGSPTVGGGPPRLFLVCAGGTRHEVESYTESPEGLRPTFAAMSAS